MMKKLFAMFVACAALVLAFDPAHGSTLMYFPMSTGLNPEQMHRDYLWFFNFWNGPLWAFGAWTAVMLSALAFLPAPSRRLKRLLSLTAHAWGLITAGISATALVSLLNVTQKDLLQPVHPQPVLALLISFVGLIGMRMIKKFKLRERSLKLVP